MEQQSNTINLLNLNNRINDLKRRLNILNYNLNQNNSRLNNFEIFEKEYFNILQSYFLILYFCCYLFLFR